MPGSPRRFRSAPLWLVPLALACCGEPTSYTRATPEDALDNAKRMIENGEAERLVDLIQAEDADQRALLNQLGRVLGALQDLASAVQRRFPAEVERFKEDARRAAAENRAGSWSRWLVGVAPGGGRGGFGVGRIDRSEFALDGAAGEDAGGPARPGFTTPPISESQRQVFLGLAKQLFTDPYGWLDEGRSKLTTAYVADDTVAVLWDGKAIAPPIGLTMQDRGEGWQVVVPWHLPGVREVRPRSRDEVMVFGSIMKTAENLVIDLRREVEGGGVRNMSELADVAVEKAAMPMLLAFFAYGNLVEARGRAAEDASAAERPGP